MHTNLVSLKKGDTVNIDLTVKDVISNDNETKYSFENFDDLYISEEDLRNLFTISKNIEKDKSLFEEGMYITNGLVEGVIIRIDYFGDLRLYNIVTSDGYAMCLDNKSIQCFKEMVNIDNASFKVSDI